MNSAKDDPGPRGEDVSLMEAAAKSKQPGWLAWLNPVAGAIGLFVVGGRARRAAEK